MFGQNSLPISFKVRRFSEQNFSFQQSKGKRERDKRHQQQQQLANFNKKLLSNRHGERIDSNEHRF